MNLIFAFRNQKRYKRDFADFILKKYKKATKAAFLPFLISTLAFYLAWFLGSATVPYLGYIPIGHTQITFLAFIVVFGTFHLDYVGNLSAGLCFGFSSWILAFIMGAIKYQNFDIAVIPRVLMAICVYMLYEIFNVKNNIKCWKFIMISIIAAILNIVLTLSFQHLHNQIFGDLKNLLPIKEWIIVHPINIIGEPIICGMLAYFTFPLIVFLRRRFEQRFRYYW
ncbi:Uncharacterised protein (plasmid) [Mesomycoplasma conjunctivae]|nr:hypothetical protein [Mycoplasmopsis fermentans]VEU67654.1 Uncharacterised protein [Mesomycoplasma conjunctivae]